MAALLGAAGPTPAIGQTAPAAAPSAMPALWVVNDADTTIFLFGTIHTHDGKAAWFDRTVKRAFDASDTLVLETIVPAALPRPAQASSGALDAAKVTVSVARDLGMRVELGADQVLSRAAAASGKPTIGLEDFGQQLEMFRALPSPARPAASAGAVVAAPAPDPQIAPFLQRMMDGWNAGDTSLIAAVVGEVRRQSPDTYRTLFAERNAHWAEWIKARLATPGIVFVAVGTGHLVGEDSVQEKLAAQGIRSARIN
ncbi:TraB/GumN family protein [Sphingomonas rosea]|uniref:TraB/GumN family protein n=1 Tax=Sphingomonas rosea TaxID=335605 RepID=A0ABP7U7Y8_9SPHN